jgi:hypothetical protein
MDYEFEPTSRSPLLSAQSLAVGAAVGAALVFMFKK